MEVAEGERGPQALNMQNIIQGILDCWMFVDECPILLLITIFQLLYQILLQLLVPVSAKLTADLSKLYSNRRFFFRLAGSDHDTLRANALVQQAD